MRAFWVYELACTCTELTRKANSQNLLVTTPPPVANQTNPQKEQEDTLSSYSSPVSQQRVCDVRRREQEVDGCWITVMTGFACDREVAKNGTGDYWPGGFEQT